MEGAAAQLVADAKRSFRRDEWPGLASRLQLIEAEIELFRGDVTAARGLYDEAVAGTSRYPIPQLDAEFQLRWAQGLVRQGLPGAAGHLDIAADIYRRHDFGQRWLDRLEGMRTALG